MLTKPVMIVAVKTAVQTIRMAVVQKDVTVIVRVTVITTVTTDMSITPSLGSVNP